MKVKVGLCIPIVSDPRNAALAEIACRASCGCMKLTIPQRYSTSKLEALGKGSRELVLLRLGTNVDLASVLGSVFGTCSDV